MSLLAFIVFIPAISALILALSPKMSEGPAALLGAGSVGLSALATAAVVLGWLSTDQSGQTHVLWHWIAAGDFSSQFSFYLDGLSVTMISVITGVGFLIHLFATWYMTEDLNGDRGYPRFFAEMNLFVTSMLILVLGNNLLLMYMGWELVGMCSYMLIGYYNQQHDNAWAAFKAFIVTRIGDVFFAIGLFLLFTTFGTLNINTILETAPQVWSQGDPMALIASLLLLGGAVGKSAQLPLQTWLPDAMAGPTPVSALIHAATMVTAGVYLIARMHGIFELAPTGLLMVGMVGATTSLLAGFAALVQTDIKRVLAYSTMSQIGYMFLALGVQAWDAAIFHLMTHAFFKALLFLTSGSIIISCHHEQNMFKMGGLRKDLKVAFWSFLIGGSALSALPLVTAGFFSKDTILEVAFLNGHTVIWMMGIAGSFLTALYTFRMIFVTFFGEKQITPTVPKGIAHSLPLITLAVLSTFVGGVFLHPAVGNVLPSPELPHDPIVVWTLIVLTSAIALAGVFAAAILFLGKNRLARVFVDSKEGQLLWRYWFAAWGFDWLYNKVLIQPWNWLSKFHHADWVNDVVNTIPRTVVYLNAKFAKAESGNLRWYAFSIFAGGAVLLVALLLG